MKSCDCPFNLWWINKSVNKDSVYIRTILCCSIIHCYIAHIYMVVLTAGTSHLVIKHLLSWQLGGRGGGKGTGAEGVLHLQVSSLRGHSLSWNIYETLHCWHFLHTEALFKWESAGLLELLFSETTGTSC